MTLCYSHVCFMPFLSPDVDYEMWLSLLHNIASHNIKTNLKWRFNTVCNNSKATCDSLKYVFTAKMNFFEGSIHTSQHNWRCSPNFKPTKWTS